MDWEKEYKELEEDFEKVFASREAIINNLKVKKIWAQVAHEVNYHE